MNESNPSDAALAELLTLTVEVGENGSTIFCNQLGQRHRVHGPAVIWPDGDKWWIQNDQLHRTDGPAVEWSSGLSSWYLNGEYISQKEFNERIKSI